MQRRNRILGVTAVALLAVLVILSSCIVVVNHMSQAQPVTSFDSCVAAGNPVVESYPEMCVGGGQSYTNPRQSVPGAQVPLSES